MTALALAKASQATLQFSMLRAQTPMLTQARVQVELCSTAFLQYLMASQQFLLFLQMLARLLQAQLYLGLTAMARLYHSMALASSFMALQTMAMLQQAEWYFGFSSMHRVQWKIAISQSFRSSQLIPIELWQAWLFGLIAIAFWIHLIDSSIFFLSQQASPKQQQNFSSLVSYCSASERMSSSLALSSLKMSQRLAWGALQVSSFSIARKYQILAYSYRLSSSQLTPMLLQQDMYWGLMRVHFLYHLIASLQSFFFDPKQIPTSFATRVYSSFIPHVSCKSLIFLSMSRSLRAMMNRAYWLRGSTSRARSAQQTDLAFSMRLYSKVKARSTQGFTKSGFSLITVSQVLAASQYIPLLQRMLAWPQTIWQFLGCLRAISAYHLMPSSYFEWLWQQRESPSQGEPWKTPPRRCWSYQRQACHSQKPTCSSWLPSPAMPKSCSGLSWMMHWQRSMAGWQCLSSNSLSAYFYASWYSDLSQHLIPWVRNYQGVSWWCSEGSTFCILLIDTYIIQDMINHSHSC